MNDFIPTPLNIDATYDKQLYTLTIRTAISLLGRSDITDVTQIICGLEENSWAKDRSSFTKNQIGSLLRGNINWRDRYCGHYWHGDSLYHVYVKPAGIFS